MFKRVSIIGLGLLGGSLCKRMKQTGDVAISAYGRNLSRLEPALDEGVVDSIDSLENIDYGNMDLLVVSTPVRVSIDLIARAVGNGSIGDNALVIDVGSVKGEVIKAVAGRPGSEKFIGCHPMAGSEKMGYAHSRHDLYEGSTVIITPHPGNRGDDIVRIRTLWEMTGARCLEFDPFEHDSIVARSSHLPHITACAVSEVMKNFSEAKGGYKNLAPFIGSGFRDVTRIASGSPAMWRDITLSNREHLLEAIGEAIDSLEKIRSELSGDMNADERLEAYFDDIKKFRDGVL